MHSEEKETCGLFQVLDPDPSVPTHLSSQESAEQALHWLTLTHHRYSIHSSETSTLSTFNRTEIVCDILCLRLVHEDKYANGIQNTDSFLPTRSQPTYSRGKKSSEIIHSGMLTYSKAMI